MSTLNAHLVDGPLQGEQHTLASRYACCPPKLLHFTHQGQTVSYRLHDITPTGELYYCWQSSAARSATATP